MTFDEVMEVLDAGNNYNWAHDASRGVFVYKPDLHLRITSAGKRLDDARVERHAKSALASSGARVVYEVFYGASFVTEMVLASVDDNRAMIPIPELGTKAISGRMYRFAKIVDTTGKLDEHIARQGFEVVR